MFTVYSVFKYYSRDYAIILEPYPTVLCVGIANRCGFLRCVDLKWVRRKVIVTRE